MALGWDQRLQGHFDGYVASANDAAANEATGHVPARVARVDRSANLVLHAGGEARATTRHRLAVGDWTSLRLGGPVPVVTAVLPRRSTLTRTDSQGEHQVIAANIDLVLLVHPLDRPVNLRRLERELVLAWASGARPVVVLTKSDLGDAAGAARRLAPRVDGVEVLSTRVTAGQGTAEVAALLAPNRTAVLLGASGAGKSSLVNHLVGSELLATGAVRGGDGKGRHTTTARHLVALPGGGLLVDTPGLRSLGLSDDGAGLEAAFGDIEELASSCRFRDCRHRDEPGCGVLAAVAGGTLVPARLWSYTKLQRELELGRQRSPGGRGRRVSR